MGPDQADGAADTPHPDDGDEHRPQNPPPPAPPDALPPETLPPHPERIPDDTGWHRAAPFLVPVPARQLSSLTRRRVLLHDPDGPRTRYDLVAVGEPGEDLTRPRSPLITPQPAGETDLDGPDAHTGPHSGRHHAEAELLVPVLDVHDFHRARLERGTRAPFRPTPLIVPLDRVWIDRIYTNPDAIPDDLVPPTPIIPPGRGHTDPQRTWLAHPERPPIRRMVRGNTCHGRLPVGTRATYCGPRELRQGLRVLSEPFLWDYGQPNLHGGLDEIDQPLWVQSVSCCTEPDYFAWTITSTAPPSWPVPLGALFLE